MQPGWAANSAEEYKALVLQEREGFTLGSVVGEAERRFYPPDESLYRRDGFGSAPPRFIDRQPGEKVADFDVRGQVEFEYEIERRTQPKRESNRCSVYDVLMLFAWTFHLTPGRSTRLQDCSKRVPAHGGSLGRLDPGREYGHDSIAAFAWSSTPGVMGSGTCRSVPERN